MESNATFNNITGLNYACGLSCYDFNHDGWDDITFATHTDGVRTFQNNQGVFEELYLFNGFYGQIRGITWVDFDHDGDADFFAARYMDSMIIMRNDGDLNFTDISASTTNPSTQANCHGVSWGDYDLDGLPDAYVSNYQVAGNIRSWLMHNLGNGQFENVANALGVSNGVKPAFQSSWMDYDLDGDSDLMVINDRYAGNSFYRNNGDGSFTNVGDETGLNIELDGMGISWTDLDHDLDYDLYISNTDSGSVLLMNEDGVFHDQAENSNLKFPGATLYGVEWLDYDNNTWDDFYGATNTPFDGGQNYFCVNNGDSFFDCSNSPDFELDDSESYVTATGDFNRDGFTDLVVLNILPQKVAVWMNNAVGGNWIKIKLQGTISNTDAIGTQIHIYAGGEEYMSYTQSGESFLGQDSQYEIIGVDDADVIDSVVVHWPSGWTDKIFALDVNASVEIVEGVTYTDNLELYEFTVCQNDSLYLVNPQNLDGYWYDGSFSDSLLVTEPGEYQQIVPTEMGFDHHVHFNITYFVTPEIDVNVMNVSCFGASDGIASIELQPEQVHAISWSSDSVMISADHLAPGNYHVEVEFINTCSTSFDFVIEEPQPISMNHVSDTVCVGATCEVNIVATGGHGLYSFSWLDADPTALGVGVHHVLIHDQMGCALMDSITIYEFPSAELEWDIPIACYGESVAIEYNVLNEVDVIFVDYQDINPLSVNAGNHDVIVLNEYGCSQLEVVSVYENDLIESNASIVCPDQNNLGSIEVTVWGGSPPYAIHWQDGQEAFHIYEVEPGSYSYTITDSAGCVHNGDVQVVLENVGEISNDLLMYPNPTNGVLKVKVESFETINLINTSGKVLFSKVLNPGYNEIDLTGLPNGSYFLKSANHVGHIVLEDVH